MKLEEMKIRGNVVTEQNISSPVIFCPFLGFQHKLTEEEITAKVVTI